MLDLNPSLTNAEADLMTLYVFLVPLIGLWAIWISKRVSIICQMIWMPEGPDFEQQTEALDRLVEKGTMGLEYAEYQEVQLHNWEDIKREPAKN